MLISTSIYTVVVGGQFRHFSLSSISDAHNSSYSEGEECSLFCRDRQGSWLM